MVSYCFNRIVCFVNYLFNALHLPFHKLTVFSIVAPESDKTSTTASIMSKDDWMSPALISVVVDVRFFIVCRVLVTAFSTSSVLFTPSSRRADN